MRCPKCDVDVLSELKADNWLKVMNCLFFLQLQGVITSELCQDLTDAMMSFKAFAMDESSARSKSRPFRNRPEKRQLR